MLQRLPLRSNPRETASGLFCSQRMSAFTGSRGSEEDMCRVWYLSAERLVGNEHKLSVCVLCGSPV